MQPPLTAIYQALAAIRDDDLRHDALLAAAAEWERHPDVSPEHLAARGVRRVRRDQWRRAVNPATPAVTSDATALAPSQQPRLSADDWIDWQERRQGLTARQQSVCDLLLAGHSQTEIADQLGVSSATVSREVSAVSV